MGGSRRSAAFIVARWIATKDFPSSMLPNGAERAFVQDLVYTTIRRIRPLRKILGALMKQWPKGELEALLYVGAAQILYMPDVPDFAAVSETVDAAKTCENPSIAKVVNGVLRNVIRRRGEFEKMIAEDGFLEHAFYSGNYYGTPRKPVEDNLAAGKDVILEIETNGAFQVKKLRPDASSLFILPPSVAELDRRLHKRATEDEETIQKRVAQAAGEIEKSDRYDYVIMNDDLDKAVEDFCAVIDGIRGVKEAAVRFSPENEDIKKMIREVLENA